MEVCVGSMKVDPFTRVAIGHDLSGDDMIEVSDLMDAIAACDTAVTACWEQLSREPDHSFEPVAHPPGASS